MIREIWNKYNVSTVLILPIFHNIISNIRTDKNEKVNILGFFIENGLINTYLLNKYYRDTSYHTLSLLFDRNLANNALNIKQKFPTLLDVIVNSKEFKGVSYMGDNILLTLKIDSKWDNDINKIIDGMYSSVSDEYKKEVVFKGQVRDAADAMANFIHINNLPARIFYKSKKLEDALLEIFLDTSDKKKDLKIEGEYYENFNKLKENVDFSTNTSEVI